jgi:hypothetical protein
VSPSSFARIQRLDQFLNQRCQFGGVPFICHRNTKFAPIFLHAVSHIHLRYSGANACECWAVGSMFGATTLSGSVVYGSQRSAYSFTIWIGTFGVQDSTYLPSHFGDKRSLHAFHHPRFPSHADFAKTASQRNSKSARALRMLLTACNLPQRASSCPVCPECLSSAGLSNCLLVGRITMSVNGITAPSRSPPTSHQNVAPASHAATGAGDPQLPRSLASQWLGDSSAGIQPQLFLYRIPFWLGVQRD